jgi:hypothetical protein
MVFKSLNINTRSNLHAILSSKIVKDTVRVSQMLSKVGFAHGFFVHFYNFIIEALSATNVVSIRYSAIQSPA